MKVYHVVASTDEKTVVTEYEPSQTRQTSYQSEADLEREFIKQLVSQGYEYATIHNSQEMITNLRKQLELLNDFTFSDDEWTRFYKECISNSTEGIVEKTRKIQVDHIQLLKRDDGTSKNIMLIDKKMVHNNQLQVLNQYQESEGAHNTRYDVTILVNGLPLVHFELKRRGIALREAFNQINRYQRDSFWASNGLYEYVQLFVISNGTSTKYYSNTTRDSHVRELATASKEKSKKTSNSYEFTSFWADEKNRRIDDLVDFTKTFFSRHTLLNILTRYCVFTVENLLLVLRPYQIAATEKIINKINISHNYKKAGTIDAGGYCSHSTGSGKTLTSYKTAQLAAGLPFIDKVLFVVDRKDLDYQTMKEYDKFEKGAANGNTSTKVLQKQLANPDAHIIITTIQKMDMFIRRNKGHAVFNKQVVIIFDECHRSQFGDMHKQITDAFKNYYLFGFTGTPIYAKNAVRKDSVIKTTESLFGAKLHSYTIIDAINDQNVLPFKVDYTNTIKEKAGIKDKQVHAIDREHAMESPVRVREVSKYILEHFDQKTRRNSAYSLKGKRVMGFNSIFAVSSIKMAKMYYAEFKKQLAESGQQLTIATIFSFAQNEEDPNDSLPDEEFDTDALDKTSRDFLEAAIRDYNTIFNTNFCTDADRFENYYKDLSMRIKSREVDMVIVVNIFLTGFDATTLNTLWVDKNLKHHGLLQAFSRTNRILNSVKTYGNIICFRNLQDETDEALSLFGDKDAGGIILLKPYEAYYKGFDEKGVYHEGYETLVNTLLGRFPLTSTLIGEQNQKDFVKLFGSILKMRNILATFDEFIGNELLTERDLQDYQSRYIDIYQNFVRDRGEGKENINDDIEFEIELIRQIEINIDYILALIEKYHKSNCKDKEALAAIDRAIDSSIQLRSKKDLIESFIATVNSVGDVRGSWKQHVAEKKEKELVEIITAENLKPEETRRYIDNAMKDGVLKVTGMEFDAIMPPVSRFGGKRKSIKDKIASILERFFEKFFGIG